MLALGAAELLIPTPSIARLLAGGAATTNVRLRDYKVHPSTSKGKVVLSIGQNGRTREILAALLLTATRFEVATVYLVGTFWTQRI